MKGDRLTTLRINYLEDYPVSTAQRLNFNTLMNAGQLALQEARQYWIINMQIMALIYSVESKSRERT
ncbi:MAG: hypothetical protein KME22_24155 [Hassallia sp. WJT32-NPBG1]|jgi:hypothetical protein|nr:hypothetical protein [Hassallia sp. WJT32-NPBG1]